MGSAAARSHPQTAGSARHTQSCNPRVRASTAFCSASAAARVSDHTSVSLQCRTQSEAGACPSVCPVPNDAASRSPSDATATSRATARTDHRPGHSDECTGVHASPVNVCRRRARSGQLPPVRSLAVVSHTIQRLTGCRADTQALADLPLDALEKQHPQKQAPTGRLEPVVVTTVTTTTYQYRQH
jgi:hypothetical protein